jgi:hypothetical protein
MRAQRNADAVGDFLIDAAIILACAATIIIPIFLTNETLLPLEAPGMLPSGSFGRPPQALQTFTTVDPTAITMGEVPMARYVAAAIRHGAIPFWIPYQGLGQPFMAEGGTAVLYPLSLVTRLFLGTNWLDVLSYTQWLLLAAFTGLYARAVGLPRGYAGFAGLAVLAGGHFLAYLAVSTVLQCEIWTPLILYGIERVLRAGRIGPGLIPIVIGTSAIGLTAHPGVAVFIVCGTVLYLIVRCALERRFDLLAKIAAGPMLAGALISAPNWAVLLSYTISSSEFFAHYDFFGHYPATRLTIPQLPALWFPFIYGDLLSPSPLGGPSTVGYWSFGWTAHIATFFAVAGCLKGVAARNKAVITLIVVAAFTLCWCMKIFPFSLIDHFVLSRRINVRYGMATFELVTAVLAGFGLLALSRGDSRLFHSTVLVWGAISAAAGILATQVILAARVANSELLLRGAVPALAWCLAVPSILGLLLPRNDGDRPWFVLVACVGVAGATLSYFPTGTLIQVAYVRLGAVALFAVVGLLVSMLLRERGTASLLTTAACITAAALIANTWIMANFQLPLRHDAATPPPFVKWLQTVRPEWRTYSLGGIFAANIPSAFHVSSINTLTALLPPTTARFFSVFLDPHQDPNQLHGIPNPELVASVEDLFSNFVVRRRFFDSVAVRYLILPRDFLRVDGRATVRSGSGLAGAPEELSPPLRRVFADPAAPVDIWENTTAIPRVFLAPANQLADNWQTAQDRFAAQPDLTGSAFVEVSTAGCPSDPQYPPDQATGRLKRFSISPNSLDIDFEAAVGGVLVITDTFMPGWRAHLNGRPVQIVRVNGTFRGVCLPEAGSYSIQMSYQPPLWYDSLGLFGIGIVLSGLLVFSAIRSARDN